LASSSSLVIFSSISISPFICEISCWISAAFSLSAQKSGSNVLASSSFSFSFFPGISKPLHQLMEPVFQLNNFIFFLCHLFLILAHQK